MPIPMSCPACGLHVHAPDETAGKRAQCPKCGHIFHVPRVPSAVPVAIPAPPPLPPAPLPPRLRQDHQDSSVEKVQPGRREAEREPIFWAEGATGLIELWPKCVRVFPKGLFGGVKNNYREIPLRQITSIQFVPATALTSGFIMFAIPGVESQAWDSTILATPHIIKHQNGAVFWRRHQKDFEALKRKIERRLY